MVRAIGSSPEEPCSLIYARLLSAIGSARSSVHLTNAYFAPDPQLLDALEAAAARGVDVTLILPGQTDSWLVFHAGRGYYERRGAILHSKTADDVPASDEDEVSLRQRAWPVVEMLKRALAADTPVVWGV